MVSLNAVVRPSSSIARGALTSGVAASALSAAASLLFGGTRELLSCLVAAALVLGFFASGQVVAGLSMLMADASGMTLIMVSYVVRVAVFGAILWLLTAVPQFAVASATTWMAVGALAALVGWLTGLGFAHSRARIPVYDRRYEAPEGWDR